jgi:outer membrane protein
MLSPLTNVSHKRQKSLEIPRAAGAVWRGKGFCESRRVHCVGRRPWGNGTLDMMRSVKIWIGAAALVAGLAAAVPAQAGDSNGDLQVKVGVTGLLFDNDTTSTSPANLGQAEVNDTVIPTLMINYYLTKNWSVELFCCFAQLNVEGKSGALGGLGKLASTWVFPPMLTAQYHFDGMGAFKPYVGAGVQYIHYFDESSNRAGTSVDIEDSWGFVLQAGADFDMGDGWSLGLDAKKVWEDTKLTYSDGVVANHDLDPWVLTANLGYRFNLSDIFGSRAPAPGPLK